MAWKRQDSENRIGIAKGGSAWISRLRRITASVIMLEQSRRKQNASISIDLQLCSLRQAV
ncbi:MAG TPA: hypothetical protein DD387_11845 [Lachnoclostridium sp.]|nr:hypothetical protein DWZ40_16640 [Clostridium sp. AF32-12BH]RHS85089.1 hypothetical protein DW922_11770 [Clostridium sp. AM42-4]HBM48453.1 hypothetical protein [Lachnoclostridium sp.]